MVSELEVEAKRHGCCRLRMWARKVIWRARRYVLRRWRAIGLDIVCFGVIRGKTGIEEDNNSRVVPGRSRGRLR